MNGVSTIPPVLTVDEAAALLRVPKQTIYDWTRGLLKGCGRKVGKHLRLFRDRLLLKVFNEGLAHMEPNQPRNQSELSVILSVSF